ncbi:MAG: ImmA/IrrE family metallo-endopeptidase [Xenococcaceae cyanobacterium MO_188.B29]|nr:ImmA/IrrE family metallo-endopeptidase [Xenococcaceae cyanobacterium MO_188.B29]
MSLFAIFRPFRFISKVEIEAIALEILVKMQHTPKYIPSYPLDASRIAEFLGLDVVWDTIADDDQGQIAARILPLEHLIEINDNIPQLQGGFGESTIAHEIGHWVLHIDVEQVERHIRLQNKGLNIQVQSLLCRSTKHLAGIEWQAQYFAGCLLMPQYILVQLSQGKDLTNWSHLYSLADELGVTISNLIHRLQDLGWICLIPNSSQIRLVTSNNSMRSYR